MNIRKWLTIGLVLGVVANVIDAVVQGNLLASYYTAPPFRQDTNILWLVAGDFVSALVFTWVYLTFAPAAGPGVGGGAKLGLYAGVLVSFPANIFLHLLIQGFPYALSWIWTVYSIAWYIVLGTIAGAMNRR